MASICRLCATLRKIESFVNLHDTSLDICMKLEKCCQLIVPRSNDVLPQNVCNECVLNLNDCWKFFQKVHESQESLSKIFYIDDSTTANDTTEKYYVQNQSLKSNAHSENNITSSSDNINHTQNMEVERLLNNITIIADNRISNEIGQNVSDNDSENGLKIEIAEQLTFDDLDESDFAIATGSIVTTNVSRTDTRFVEIQEEDQENQDIAELQLHNLPTEINVDENVHETETNKFVDQTIDQIENQLNKEYRNDEMENSSNMDNTDNSNSTSMLSTSLSRSMIMESLNESDLETLGSWNDYIWKCVYCQDFISENVDNLRLHIYSEHQTQSVRYVCIDCHKTFDKYYTFINHVKLRHRIQLQLCCDLCSEFFDTANILAEHRSTGHVQEIHFGNVKKSENDLTYCSICAKAFKNKTALVVHVKGHIPSDQKYKFPCDYCDKIFATKANWKAHNKIHVGLKDYVCALCGRGFVQKANLDEHMLTHTEEKPFECEECHRRFKTSDRLAKHISVHSDSRPHKCSICGSCFREKDTLRVHSRIHTGEMPYSCEFCGKRFRFRSVLKTHRHQHTGERPYSCLECNHHFTNWPNYNKHMKRRHGISENIDQTVSNVTMNVIQNDLNSSQVANSSNLSPARTSENNTMAIVAVNNSTLNKQITSSSSLSSSTSALSALKASSISRIPRARTDINQTSTPVTH
ncbi:zinc finger protein 182-like [Condylostylus longicornis]|uniref:zinc finger protein 182-like n=1 Tax=Condylostylus longicornis TaxID=2530218 RepID=UPI00244E077D|nr:zinc finger protein 182-like [Condylostylus longicornis]